MHTHYLLQLHFIFVSIKCDHCKDEKESRTISDPGLDHSWDSFKQQNVPLNWNHCNL